MFLNHKYIFPFSILSNTGDQVSESTNLKITSTSAGAQRWEMTINLEPIFGRNENSGQVFAHKAEHGHRTPFDIPMPQDVEYDFESIGAPTVFADHDAGVKTVRLRSQSTGVRTVALRGTPVGAFIRFANHPKVYKITSIANTGTRDANVGIFPALMQDVDNGAVVDFTPAIRVKYDPDVPLDINFAARGFYNPQLSVVEAL